MVGFEICLAVELTGENKLNDGYGKIILICILFIRHHEASRTMKL